jgi:outer membrane lipoprotein-sorting protein
LRKERFEMTRRSRFFILGLLFLALFLSGCVKKVVRIPSIEAPPEENPVVKLLEAFSAVESFQARASIRVETVRMGEAMNFLLNGVVLYKRPDKLRILGYHPFGMDVFDALYRNGEFFLLSPLQKKAYTGEISQFKDLIEKARIRISTEKAEGSEIPNRIRIEAVGTETRVELRLKEISINSSLPEGSFEWTVPEGVEVQSLAKLLKGKSPR